MRDLIYKVFVLSISIIFGACSGEKARAAWDAETVMFEERGAFSGDSAYAYVARQVEFGPRVPGTASHDACVEWLVGTLRGFGADTVMIIGTETTAWNGDRLPVRNILARFKGTSASRPILLAAHYDTRPWADEDSDPDARLHPFDGANDGASGVGVLLEIARNIGKEQTTVPVDILLTDVEDYGSSGFDSSWCLGAQQFAGDLPYAPGDMPRWGILLDMVGGHDAHFPREYFSVQYASVPTAKVWDVAGKLGLRNRFPMSMGGAITDDHIPLTAAGIHTTDIIESANSQTGSFPPSWHTREDNLSNIDATTLSDVGRTVLNVVYYEK